MLQTIGKLVYKCFSLSVNQSANILTYLKTCLQTFQPICKLVYKCSNLSVSQSTNICKLVQKRSSLSVNQPTIDLAHLQTSLGKVLSKSLKNGTNFVDVLQLETRKKSDTHKKTINPTYILGSISRINGGLCYQKDKTKIYRSKITNTLLWRKRFQFFDHNLWGPIFTTLLFLRNIRMGPISQCVTLQWAGNAGQVQTLWLVRPIREIRIK